MHTKKSKVIRLFSGTLILTLLFGVFLLGWMFPVHASDENLKNESQPLKGSNVLVLQSYHRGHDWTDDQGNAIISTLSRSGMNAAISLEYMDWKRYPSEENLRLLYARLKFKYENIKIDLIMTTDDAALSFALEHREQIFSDAPIVFSGVAEQDAYGILRGQDHVTGVYQVMDPEGTVRAAVTMIPGLKKIYIIHDMSESGVSTGEMIERAVKTSGFGLNMTDLSGLTLEQLLAAVNRLDQQSAVFLASYNSDVNQVVMPIQDLSEKISRKSSAPVFTIDEGTFGYGTVGGSITSGKEHGKIAAELGIRILEGESADSIPIADKKSVYWGFDYLQLERYGIPVNKLPENSRIIHQPFSFYETYKTFVLSNIAIFIILFAFIIFLLFNLKYRKQSEQALKRQKEAIFNLAYYSPVTGLPNRIHLKDKLEEIIVANTDMPEAFSLIYIDIDNFKEVNDSFGHSVGDKILASFAMRLKESIGPNDNAFSLGGDEFIVLVRQEEGLTLADRVDILFETILRPFFIEENTFHLSASGGIVSHPEHGKSYIELLKNADTAMYRSKESGKGSFTYFNQFMSDEAVQKTKMQSQLRDALAHGDFMLYYQPQLDIKTGLIWGYEALIRWNNKEFGFVHPMTFIKIAEESRLIIPIGEWVLETACRFIKMLHDLTQNGIIVSVNISVIQFVQDNFVDRVLEILQKTGLEPKYLELEITETVFLNSSRSAIEKMERLKGEGIRVALDDFGTGYSSLSYLSQLPITTLKIDKAFIKSIFESSKNMVLTNTIVRMGHAMGLELVVEGVETKAQKELFIQFGCDRLQGYHIGKPVPSEEILLHTSEFQEEAAVRK